jgi:hypothetical protein
LTATRSRYRAFLSYSHAADGHLAPALQVALQGFARPWHQVRTLRIFRDKTSLSANPELWPTIEKALSESEWLLFLASPASAASPWVAREIAWWLEHRSVRTLLILLTDGEIVWDSGSSDFDWSRTTALPQYLRGRLSQEPLHVDLRWAKDADRLSLRHSQFHAAVLDIVAPLLGRSKEDLDGEDVRQHRRNRRVAGSAIAGILLFAGLAAAGQVRVNRANEVLALQVKSLQLDKARTLSRQIATYIGGLQDRVAVMARTLEFEETPLSERLVRLRESQALMRYVGAESPFCYVTVVDTRGVGAASGIPLLDPTLKARLVAAHAASRDGQRVLSEPMFASSLGETVVVLSEPLRNQRGDIDGVVLMVASLEPIQRMATGLGEGYIDIYVVDPHGHLLVHSGPAGLAPGADLASRPMVASFLQSGGRTAVAMPFTLQAQGKSVRMLGANASVPGYDWGVIVELEAAKADSARF